MATLVLQVAGTAIGSAVGGPAGAAIGSAIGGTLGSFVDRALLGGEETRRLQGPRLTDLDGITANEGTGLPRIYGRVRIGGQVIWATEFEEVATVERSGRSGGKSASGGGGGSATTRYSYFANVAIALCEGPVAFVRRIWADGTEIDRNAVTMRFYPGDEAQEPDPLIVAKQETGEVPAFRGTAYLVLERFALADYGNRLPQFSFEVVRGSPGLPARLRAINLIPGSTEFGYAPHEVRAEFGYGASQSLNRAQWTHASDWEASLDALQALAPNLERVTLIAAWFGDDLRAGECRIEPRVERTDRATSGDTWVASGLTRATARPNSQSDDRPNYGGSPSDTALLAAIRDLTARGLGVAVHPFLLMDIPPGNTLTDPYTGAAGQPPFPWRGRITCDPAPGRPGSPEGGAGVAEQIAAFFGTAQPADFAASGEAILYSGPDEWSYRRMVLHFAKLAVLAGGVETFFLGSELVGLTRLADATGDYPAVAHLRQLAADVRSILGPGTRLSYAADWTEYGADVRDNGLTLRFPLDPLWADPAIDAIAIDAYPPLSDWRPGRAHLDAATADGALDPGYLRDRIASGEAFDWYYPDSEARDAQARQPITDGAFGTPWVYRAKDILSWWSEPHVPRTNGVQAAGPTALVPKSKPILLAEIGCPAVRFGPNQPNVFPDPKSSENAYPHFSDGARDDLAPWRLIEAWLDRFDPEAAAFSEGNNPISPLTGQRMIDPGFIAPWAWDARPFPAFPAHRDLWSDAANWARGHWLNGRLEALPVADLVAMIAADYGLDALPVAPVDGMVDGYAIDRPMSARAALEPVVDAFGLAMAGPDRALVPPPVRPEAILRREDIVPDRNGVELEIRHRDAADLPRALDFGFLDPDRDHRRAVIRVERPGDLAGGEAADEAALVLPRGAAHRLAEIRLMRLWAGRETFRFNLRPGRLDLAAGDCVTLETAEGERLVRLTRIADGPYRQVEAEAFRPGLDDQVAVPGDEPAILPPPELPGAPLVEAIELPAAGEGGPVRLAVRADPWRGPYAVLAGSAGSGLAPLATAVEPARIGSTLAAFPPGPLWRWDRQSVLDLRLEGGSLATLSESAVLAGGNLLALIGADGAIEIVAARKAELVGVGRYRLSEFLRGLALSEPEAARMLPPGARVLVLDDALVDLGNAGWEPGRETALRIVPAGRDAGDPASVPLSVSARGLAARPLAPVHPRLRREAGGVRLSFARRPRYGGDSFDLYEVPLHEETERYRLDILDGANVKRRVDLSASEYFYPLADELADFGAPNLALDLRLEQISASWGPGSARVATVPVEGTAP